MNLFHSKNLFKSVILEKQANYSNERKTYPDFEHFSHRILRIFYCLAVLG